MKKTIGWMLALVMALMCMAGYAEQAEVEQEATGARAVAESALMAIVQGEYETLSAMMDEAALSQMPEDVIQAGWASITDVVGSFDSIAEAYDAPQGDGFAVQMLVQHEAGQSVLSIMFDADMRITMMQMQAVPSYDETEPLPLPEGAAEENIVLREGADDETGGLLVLPKNAEKAAAVVLIHGSGASDRDENVFGMRPFRDIAMGLAERGIASIRYDKFPFAHADLSQDITIDREYVQDVKDAVALLKADERIGDIYLVGHSQGAMLMPRLLQACEGDVKGGVLLAGTPRGLWEMSKMQNEDILAKVPPEQAAEGLALIEVETAKGERLLEMTEEELLTETIFGVPADYQYDMVKVDPIETAKALELPLLILQGEKDFQVKADVDFVAYQERFGDASFVTYKLYPDLTHMFVKLEGEASGSLADYEGGGHVETEVIEDIANWIEAQK